VEQIRRLIESDEVAFWSIRRHRDQHGVFKYINQKAVPHLFIGTGATVFNDPGHYPWTMSWTPHYASEGEIYARYILSTQAHRQDRHSGAERRSRRDYLTGFKRGLGDKAASMIVSQQAYNTTDPTVRFPGGVAGSPRADVFFHHHHPQILGAGHPQGL